MPSFVRFVPLTMDGPMQPLPLPRRLGALALALALGACARATTSTPSPIADPRVGLRAGLHDAGEAVSNLRILSRTPAPKDFAGETNSDLAFTGKYVIQGNYNGWQVWDISTPTAPKLVRGFVCPASQSDVSVYKNLLFVSGEGLGGRLDCGTQGVREAVSKDRLRGLRIFRFNEDFSVMENVGNVQTCRGSHTHTVLEDPKDRENVYVYISGSAGVRAEGELPGCVNASPDKDPNSALFRIEVIKVPLAHPEQAAIVSSPRIFKDLTAPPRHGEAPEDVARAAKAAAEARARGAFTATIMGSEMVLPPQFTKPMLDSIAKARGGTTPSAADSAALRAAIPAMIARMVGERPAGAGPRPGPNQCHDITVYPALGLAGGACEGYGLLLDIRDPANPVRIAAVADSNFSYWHSATFSNDGSKVLFSDEWGGGGAPKCRATDKKEWGANAIFTVQDGKMDFQSYYKIPAAQTSTENCVAHNGSLIPIPGRDVMVQAFYQGGITVFDWTDPKRPQEIAFFDRGPIDSARFQMGGSWSVYWYNGHIVSSEIARGLDVAELVPSPYLTQNEIDAAKTVHFDQLNAQGQPKLSWPPSFALARAYVDQLERNKCLSTGRIGEVRAALASAEKGSMGARQSALGTLASQLQGETAASCDQRRMRLLTKAVQDLSVTS